MSVAITNRQRARNINLRRLKAITNGLLLELGLENSQLGICLVDAREMTRLNETFLRHAGSTDVITFDYGFEVPSRPAGRDGPSSRNRLKPGSQTLQGEIFVCVDEAVLQARKFDTSWQSEVVRYIVHGTLHLLGFDDSSPAARIRMKRAENRHLHGLSRRFSLAQLSRPARLSA